MKTSFSKIRTGALLLVGCTLGLLGMFQVMTKATPASLTPVSLTNTTNTVTGIPQQSYLVPAQNATITHNAVGLQGGGLQTNNLYVNIYANAANSTATNGRVLIGVWYPQTNACTETILGANYPITNYLSFDLCVSNTVTGLSGSYGQ